LSVAVGRGRPLQHRPGYAVAARDCFGPWHPQPLGRRAGHDLRRLRVTTHRASPAVSFQSRTARSASWSVTPGPPTRSPSTLRLAVTTPVATLPGRRAYLGTSVALSAMGRKPSWAPQRRLERRRAVFVYAETGGTWSTNPWPPLRAARTNGSAGRDAVGRRGTALLGFTGYRDANGAYVYTGAGQLVRDPGGQLTGTGVTTASQLNCALSRRAGRPGGAPSVSSGPVPFRLFTTVAYGRAPRRLFFTGGADAGLGGQWRCRLTARWPCWALGRPLHGLGERAAYLYTETGGTGDPPPSPTPAPPTRNWATRWPSPRRARGARGCSQCGLIAGAPQGQATGAVYIYDEVGSTWSTTPSPPSRHAGPRVWCPISLSAMGRPC